MSEPVGVTAKGILFDMDGVLISSIGSVRRCWRRWAKMYGVPNAEEYEVPHGVRAIEIVKSLRPGWMSSIMTPPTERMPSSQLRSVARSDGVL